MKKPPFFIKRRFIHTPDTYARVIEKTVDVIVSSEMYREITRKEREAELKKVNNDIEYFNKQLETSLERRGKYNEWHKLYKRKLRLLKGGNQATARFV